MIAFGNLKIVRRETGAANHIDPQPVANVRHHDAEAVYRITNILLGAAPMFRPGTKLGQIVDVNHST